LLFPTADYAIFFLAVFAMAWSLRPYLAAHKALLVVASCAFYSYWDWRFVPLLVGIALLGGAVARGLQILSPARVRARRWLLGGGVALCLLTLAFFKYLGFAATSVLSLLAWLGVNPGPSRLPEIALPIGVSFFVFHAISLMVDASRGKIAVRVRAVDSLLYIAFFPQLVAGPILRAASFLPQLASPPPNPTIDAGRALELISVGLVKKVLIAQVLASKLVDPVFESPADHSSLEVLLGVYGYATQIYCDFSGYSDLAIGSALLLGYKIPINFDAPYRANSPRDFWRRWHISLSSWLRDYLFLPLGGSRAGRARTLLNVGITMLLGGLWHGAAWTFVVWGAFHGAWLIVHRLWSDANVVSIQRLRKSLAWRVAAPLLTFHFVCLGWVLFRSVSLSSAGELLGALFAGGLRFSLGPAVVLAIVIGLGAQLLSGWRGARLGFTRLPLPVQGLLFALVLLLIDALGPRGVAPFIYFQF
jgi:alginate O-acetyltransferase complex protein AlgI